MGETIRQKKICILSFYCISKGNGEDSVMMLATTKETHLLSEVTLFKLQQACEGNLSFHFSSPLYKQAQGKDRPT
jgi:hypothetical protein